MSVLVHFGLKVIEAIKESDAVQEFVKETVPEAIEKVANAAGDILDNL